MSAVAGTVLADAPLRSVRPVPRAASAGAVPTPTPVVAQRPAPTAAELIAKADLGGEVGFVVADARTGLVLEAHEGDAALPPASVAKALTAEYGLTTLGSDHRYATRFVATGPVQNGRLMGDLVLAGSGDPMLDTDAMASLVGQLKDAGVREISGDFKLFAGDLPYVREIDPDQPDHVGYNPSVCGLNLNFNRVHFQWQKSGASWAVSMDARSETLRPAVTVAKMAVVNRDLPVYTYRDARGVDEWTVAAGALGNGGARWLPVRRPDLYTGEVVKVLAAAQGIRLPAAKTTNALPGGTVIARHDSASLSTIVRLMLKYSTNLTAEVVGLSASRARGAAGGGLKGSARAMNAWAKERFGTGSVQLVDHSGLGDDSRISARDMVKMLVKVGPGSALHAHMKEIVPKDAEGKPDPDAPHKIHAKTGSLNFVSTLAGYVTAADGTELAFAIFSADTARRAQLSPEQMERPDGGRAWKARARWLQHQFINRWTTLYGV